MSLFPAYVQDSAGLTLDVGEPDRKEFGEASLAMEVQLLASDSEGEAESVAKTQHTSASSALDDDYYMDDKFDSGNLRVSTLYFPGRPRYDYRMRRAIGLARVRWEQSERGRRGRPRPARYYSPRARPVALDDAADCAERERALRRLLDDRPDDVALWLTLIDFHEARGPRGADAALAAAEQAAARVPGSRLLREARQRARRAQLSPDELWDRLRADLADDAASDAAARRQLWAWSVETAGARGGVEASAAAAASALARAARGPRDPLLYPRLVLAHGQVARAAGLWEHLVLLLELLAAMCFPPTPAAAAFPPRADPAVDLLRDGSLLEKEDELIMSGLPLGVVWARVERARAAAHWRPAPGAAPALDADPQRTPLPADVADLLLPVADPRAAFLLAVNMLRLAKVPLMGGAASALGDGGGSGGWGEGGGAAGAAAERALALVRAARLLPPRHPARPEPRVAARALALLVDPPHYFSDHAGYLSWVNSLWDACCSWFEGPRRTALVCWRLRWLHALALALPPAGPAPGPASGPGPGPEAARLHGAARALLEGHPPADPLPYAQLARLQAALAPGPGPGAGAGPGPRRGQPAARRTALHALGAALRDERVPAHYRLYIARVVREVCGAQAPEAAWALAVAALARPLPADTPAGLRGPPPAALVQEAYELAEQRCAALERRWADAAADGEADEDEDACWAMLPDEAEWAAARVLLAPAALLPGMRARLERAAPPPEARGRAARYGAAAAAALAGRLRGRAWRSLAPLHPAHALLALGAAGAPLWAWAARPRARPPAWDSGAALAHLLPPLYAALAADWAPREASRVVAACARAGAGGGAGAAVWAARLEAEARAERPRAARALLAALDALPGHKWLYVRGAQWAPDAAELADLLLHRHLRVHTLLDELQPVPPRAPAAACTDAAADCTDADADCTDADADCTDAAADCTDADAEAACSLRNDK